MTGPRGGIGVRINDGRSDRHVTMSTRDLRFRKTAPGGFADASMRILLPRKTFTDLGPADKVYLYSARNGSTLWEGFTQNPGTQDGPDGQGFNLSCLGTTILAGDESRPLVYIDSDLDKWLVDPGSAPSAGADTGPDPTGAISSDGIKCQFNPGQPLTTGSVVQIAYNLLGGYGMQVGALRLQVKSGKADANYNVEYVVRGGTPATIVIQTATSTSPSAVLSRYVVDDYTSGTSAIALHLARDGGATNVADDTTWTWFYNMAVLGRRMDRTGTLLNGAAGMVTASYVLASWVVEDLLGRLLTFVDEGISRVDTTTWQIDQLAYHDGIKAAALFDDLTLWEPDYLWELLESTANGYRFNYRAWPTDARYEISTSDGYDAPGADVDLCNRIAVYWTDAKGVKQTTVRGASVLALGSGSPVLADGTRDPAYTGRVRDADPITLPDGQGSLANAQRIGDQVLSSKANPPTAATAVVDRPILDKLTGNMVFPWEIEPGYLVRVRETGDLLRMTEMEYVDNDCAAMLTLGQPVLTVEQRIARLENAKVA